MNLSDLSFLDSLEDFIVSLISKQIYLAPIFLLVIEEAGIPIPVPGDIVIAYIGYEVSKGAIAYWLAFCMILVSVLTGASILYVLSVHFGHKIIYKFGKFMHLHPERLATVEKHFKTYGPWVIIFGRHIPGFRIPVTIFSGISKVSYKTFILSTFISVIFWIAFYLEVGRRLGPKTISLLKAHNMYYVTFLVLLLSFLGYLGFLFVTRGKKKT